LSQPVAGSRLTSNIKITLKITFTSEIFANITRSLAVVLLHLKFCKKILILIFFLDLFSVECKFFFPNSADNTMENRAISLVESSRDNSLIACRTSSDFYPYCVIRHYKYKDKTTASDLSTIQFRLIFKGHKSLEYLCLVIHLTSVSTISYAESNGGIFILMRHFSLRVICQQYVLRAICQQYNFA
jgi:hypothetical protein